MGIRKNILLTLKSLLDGLIIADEENDVASGGNGTRLTAITRAIDFGNLSVRSLPLIAILPAPHTIQVGINGRAMDNNYRVAIYGFINKQGNEDVTLAGENAIDVIIRQLTAEDSIEKMCDAYFSISEFGPILNEVYAEDGTETGLAYISIPLLTQFVEH
jgi:hypothetical protein